MLITVSVIIPVLNGVPFIARAVRSALNQTGVQVEVLVADNGSTDGTWSILEGLAAADRRVRPLDASAQRGAGFARNAGLDAATGDWIAVLDADDVMYPTRLERLIAFAEQRRAGVVADNQRLVDMRGKFLRLAWSPKAFPHSIDAAGFITSNLNAWRSMDFGFLKPVFRREVISASGMRYPSHIRVGEDSHFLYLLLKSGQLLHLCRDAYYIYYQTPGSLCRSWTEPDLHALLLNNQAELDSLTGDETNLRTALINQRLSIAVQLTHYAFIDAVKNCRLDHAMALLVDCPPVIPRIIHYGRRSVVKRLAGLRHAGHVTGAGAGVA